MLLIFQQEYNSGINCFSLRLKFLYHMGILLTDLGIHIAPRLKLFWLMSASIRYFAVFLQY